MRDKLTNALANVLYVGVGATVIAARATSNVATACVVEGKSFCTDVKTKYDEKKSDKVDEAYGWDDMQGRGIQVD